MNMNNLEG